MKLKSLTLINFKSFKDQTIKFSDYLNMIVGPNGSGKSNIIDALIFLFGSLKGKQLRISKSQDLIRFGENSCKVIGEFEINGERYLISREISKSGKNIYKINNKTVTRGEILDFFEKNGIHYEGHNFVLQGEITKIVKSSPKERLEIIKECVGIKQFDERKNKAMEELEKANTELRQIEVLYKEKKSKFEHYKKEYENLKLYNSLSMRLKQIEQGKLQKDKEKHILKLENLLNKKNELNGQRAQINAKINDLKNKIQELKNKESDLINKIEEFVNSDLIEEKSVIETEIKQIEELESKLGEKLDLISKEISKLEKKESELKEEKKKLQEELNILLKEYNELKRKEEKEIKKIIEQQEEYKKIKEKIKELDENLKFLRQERDELFKKYSILKENQTDILRLKSLEDELKNLEKNRKALKEEKQKLESQLNAIKTTLEKIKEEISEYKGKLSALKSIGINPEVVDILKESVDGVYDFAINLCTYDKKFAQGIEAAAGRRFFYIVVKNIDTALKCLDVLKKLELGKQSFIPLNVKHNFKELKKPSDPGVIDFCINLVSYPKEFDNVFKYIFGNTVLVKSHKDFKAIKGKFRAVSLDGDIYETSNIITGGSKTKFLDIKDILDKRHLHKEYEELLKDKEILEEKIKEIAEEIYLIDRKIIEINKEIEVLKSKIIDGDIEEIEEKLITVEKEIQKLESERISLLEYEPPKINIKRESEKYIPKIKEVERKISDVDKEISKVQTLIKELSNQIVEIKESKISNRLKLKRLKERLSIINETLKEVDVESIKEKLENVRKEISKFNEELETSQENLKLLDKELIRVEYEIKKCEEILENINKKIDESIPPIFVDDPVKEMSSIKKKLESMTINFNAEVEFNRAKEEFEQIKEKYEKLIRERDKIIELIKSIEKERYIRFMKGFKKIRENFQEIFSEIMKGYGDLKLIGKDPLEGGIEIVAQPYGKKISSIESLSGGEKTLTALAFILSITFYNPYPIYIFDEPDQQLDKLNAEKLGQYLKKLSEKSQVICISHRDNIVKYGDKIIGVYMREGVSATVSLDKDNIFIN